MDRKLRVAILGGGGILAAHAPGYTRLTEICDVVAVAETNTALHARICELLKKDVPIYDDYNKIFELDGIDAVDVILPHFLHRDAVLKAAKKGIHVLCEKVMARNVYECQEMIDACAEAKVELVICHDRRYAGDWVTLKKVIDSGDLGEILFWKLEHNQNVVFPEGTWVRTVDGLGGGAIMSCLTHQIDALRWYGGEIDKVECMTKIVPSRMEGETIGVVTAQMKSGALALLSINWHTQSHSWGGDVKNGLWYEFNHVTGTRGEAYFMHGKGTFVKLYEDKSKTFEYDMKGSGEFVKINADYDISGHQKCIEEFVKKARGEEAVILTPGSDTIKTVEVAEAAYISEKSGKAVILPITPTQWSQRPY